MADIEEFNELLSRLKESVEKERERYLRNESAVRMQLIDPILSFLSWDLQNPLHVIPEDRTGEGPADYCLMLEDGEKRGLFVEAKNMSKEPQVGLSALMRYCVDMGVLYGISSNGQKWLLFRAFEEGKSRKERILWTVDIFEDPVDEVFAKLTQISREALPELDARVRQAETVEGLVDRVLQNLAPQVISGVSEAVEGQPEFDSLSCTAGELDRIVRGRLSLILRGVLEQDIDGESQELTEQVPHTKTDSDLAAFYKERGMEELYTPTPATGERTTKHTGKKAPQRPDAVILFGKKILIRFSYEILTVVASELVRRGALSRNNIPVRRGYACFLVSNSPKHPTGDKFKTSKEIGKGLWIEGHCSTDAAIDYAKKLLEHCGCKASDLRIV